MRNEGDMTRNQLKTELNAKLGQVLRQARTRSGQSLSGAAAALALSETELHSIENRPAEIPCNKLYLVIDQYGSFAHLEVQEVLCEIQVHKLKSGSRRIWITKIVRWLNTDLRKRFHEVSATLTFRSISNLYRQWR